MPSLLRHPLLPLSQTAFVFMRRDGVDDGDGDGDGYRDGDGNGDGDG